VQHHPSGTPRAPAGQRSGQKGGVESRHGHPGTCRVRNNHDEPGSRLRPLSMRIGEPHDDEPRGFSRRRTHSLSQRALWWPSASGFCWEKIRLRERLINEDTPGDEPFGVVVETPRPFRTGILSLVVSGEALIQPAPFAAFAGSTGRPAMANGKAELSLDRHGSKVKARVLYGRGSRLSRLWRPQTKLSHACGFSRSDPVMRHLLVSYRLCAVQSRDRRYASNGGPDQQQLRRPAAQEQRRLADHQQGAHFALRKPVPARFLPSFNDEFEVSARSTERRNQAEKDSCESEMASVKTSTRHPREG